MSNIAFEATRILDAAAVPGVGPVFVVEAPQRVFQATLNGGTSATIVIEVSLDNLNFIPLATITLGAGTLSDGFVSSAPWRYVRAHVTALTGGTVTVFVGV